MTRDPISPANAGILCAELTPAKWPDLERLFGANGACGGCWCMSWRVALGERWQDVKGAEAKRRFKALVRSGKALGALAYVDGEPVAWCSFGPRPDYAKLDRAPSLKAADAADVWSIPCFFVRPQHRGQGVAGALLAFALTAMRARGVAVVEGYPAKAPKAGGKLPGAFAWTGTVPLFAAAGFAVAGNRDGGKVRVRRALAGVAE